MHRFFLTDTLLELDRPVDISPLAHQLRAVLRMEAGDRILLLDGSGDAFLTEIRSLDRRRAVGHVLERERAAGEPPFDLTLYQCALKGDRFEWVLQKGTEIGVTRFVPVISARTVVRPAAKLRKKYDRWRAIIREAAEQCGRGRLPELAAPLAWQEAVVRAAGLRLLPWEGERATAPGVGRALARHTAGEAVALLLGPEGGAGREEVEQAMAAGWQPVSLGPRVLRAETAALVAAALVLYSCDALGPRRTEDE